MPTHGGGAYSAVHANAPIGNGHISQIPDKGRPTFGVDLAEQMARDNVELPAILEKCCAAIEKYGLQSQGIYRISGMARKVASLKERLDKGSHSLAPSDSGLRLFPQIWTPSTWIRKSGHLISIM